MEPENKEIKAAPAVQEKRFRTFKYIADCISWSVTVIGVVVDHIKDNPFPKKTSDEYNK